MLGKISLFVSIAVLSVAAALWLSPLGPSPLRLAAWGSLAGPSAMGRSSSGVHAQAHGSLRPPSATAGSRAAEKNPSDTDLSPKSAEAALSWGGEERGAGNENALSVAACPLGMVFVAEVGVCIDRYEYPNLPQVVPATLVSFEEAKKACDGEGKRLCTDKEWTEACLDVPSGLTEQQAYGAGRCNYGGATSGAGAPGLGAGPTDEGVGLESIGEPERVATILATVDKRMKSGRMADCVSSGGAADMLGNVQEWVQSGNPSYEAAQKGGYFATPAASCRDASNVRHHHSRHPGSGFRCCVAPLLKRRLLSSDHKAPVP